MHARMLPECSHGEKPQLPHQRSSSVINTRMNDRPDAKFVLHFGEWGGEREDWAKKPHRTEDKTRTSNTHEPSTNTPARYGTGQADRWSHVQNCALPIREKRLKNHRTALTTDPSASLHKKRERTSLVGQRIHNQRLILWPPIHTVLVLSQHATHHKMDRFFVTTYERCTYTITQALSHLGNCHWFALRGSTSG